ncbi:hypothetical protein [Mycoplasma suis]|uniref:Uncharacterized protein n=2 Tax=Mycoplasma suis TaxID=57372 RepID=F0QS18_MYCSL|nr:hypothetical protein [Mycoplasma suis]ADX98288.1 hypothetical protein MSU_0763 [Mycoplasma suis str. Illinois]CBZ40803.1 hypothetical protein MSUIS_07100 [Mycoplasma suis KI3806]
MFSLGLLNKGLMGLISLGGIGGGVGSGLGSIFGNNSQSKNELIKREESSKEGLSSGIERLSQTPVISSQKSSSDESGYQGGTRVRRNVRDSVFTKTQQQTAKVTQRKQQVQKPTTPKPFSPFDVPQLTEAEKKQPVLVKTTSGDRISCLHTWWSGVYQNGAICRYK